MSDLISRQTVLARVRLNYSNHQTVERHEIEDIIKSEPSAENKGEWINETPNEDVCSIYTCSECGMSNLWESPFCPSCGADMRNEYCSECECKEECDGIEYMSKDQCEKKRGWQ